MDVKELQEQNKQLSEQVKFLEETRKELSDIQQLNEFKIKQIKNVSDFALKNSGNYVGHLIMVNAIDLLRSIFPMHAGIGIYFSVTDDALICVGQDHNTRPMSSEIAVSSIANEKEFSVIKPATKAIIFANQGWSENNIFQKYVAKNSHLSNFLQNYAEGSRGVLLPLPSKTSRFPGFLIAFHRSDLIAAPELKFPTEEDMPFLSLIASHVEAALENAMMHRQIEYNARALEERVQHRTEELGELNKLLEDSMHQLKDTQSELLETSRQMGMSEVATGVLHNIGNILNSINVSVTTATEEARSFRFATLDKALDLLNKHLHEATQFLTEDPQGKHIPNLLAQLSTHLNQTQEALLKELESLEDHLEHAKSVITTQQAYAHTGGLTEKCAINDVLEDALALSGPLTQNKHILVERDYDWIMPFYIDRHRVLQILVNLINNAVQAVIESPATPKKLRIRACVESYMVQISINDNGIGIDPSNLVRIFGQGFSTKKEGHGFGLHSCALTAKEMGGSLSCTSKGLGCGATFQLSVPFIEHPQNTPQGEE